MVWACLAKGSRMLVIHEPKVGPKVAAKPGPKTKSGRRKAGPSGGGVSMTKRYTFSELMKMTKAQQKEWMVIEETRPGNEEKLDNGCNRFTHVRKCLAPLYSIVGRRKGKFSLLQDNAKSHVSNYSRMWLHLRDIKTLDHPANSPDLNPCELLWCYLKRRVAAWKSMTETQLRKRVKEEFDKIPQKMIDNWVGRYWSRIQLCRDLKGKWVGDVKIRKPTAVMAMRG